jgi:hypothetical protein
VSVPTVEIQVSPAASRPRIGSATRVAPLTGWRLYIALAAVAILIAALSLLLPSTPSYDPWSWLVWGREIIHLDLHLQGGPSWKPLTVIMTTIFALFGSAQPDLLLVASRAGAVIAVLMTFRITWRIARPLTSEWSGEDVTRWALLPALLGATIAAASLVNSGGFISDNALGYSEGLMTALVLVALDRHLDGARRQAFAVGFFAALDRPELWLLWGPYGLYLWWKDPGARWLVVGLFVMIPVLWFLPSLWGSGSLLGGVTRALHPRSNSAAFAKCPFCTEFTKHAWPRVMDRIKAPGLLAMAAAAFGLWRTRSAWWRHHPLSPGARARLLLVVVGAIGWLWWIGVSLETQAGFSGNDRYLVLGTALISIAGGVGWGWLAAAIAGLLRRINVRERGPRHASLTATSIAGTAVALAIGIAVPPWIGSGITNIPAAHRSLVYQAHLREDASTAIHKLGGPSRVLSCGTVMTEGFQVPMVAYDLGVRTLRVEAQPTGIAGPPWPNTVLQDRDTGSAALLPAPAQIIAWERDGAHYRSFRQRTFWVFTTCPTTAGAG